VWVALFLLICGVVTADLVFVLVALAIGAVGYGLQTFSEGG
jgi:hypothetical protein